MKERQGGEKVGEPNRVEHDPETPYAPWVVVVNGDMRYWARHRPLADVLRNRADKGGDHCYTPDEAAASEAEVRQAPVPKEPGGLGRANGTSSAEPPISDDMQVVVDATQHTVLLFPTAEGPAGRPGRDERIRDVLRTEGRGDERHERGHPV